MLKSSNFDSIIDATTIGSIAECNEVSGTPQFNTADPGALRPTSKNESPTTVQTQKNDNSTVKISEELKPLSTPTSPSIAVQQLSKGFLEIYEPPLVKVRNQLKELIGKQNKIYIDLSTEKYKLDNAEVAKLFEMMNNVKVYREKLIKIKKRMQNIYQRSKAMKKRVANIQASKQKELQRKLQKQQLEESLIGK